MQFIDSHCHLTAQEFNDDREQVIERAKKAGVQQFICIIDSLSEANEALELAKKYEQLFCTVGVHPHNASEWNSESETQIIDVVQANPKVVAIGEIGLDYHYDNSPRDTQKQVLTLQLQLANRLQKPVVLHNRDSWDDFFAILVKNQPVKAVLHCCTEPWERVEQWLELGYMVSFTGIATYKNAEAIRTVIKHCPLDRIMIETDAPYLAPMPHRGKRCEPAFVAEVARTIAAVKEISLAEVALVTTANAQSFFSL